MRHEPGRFERHEAQRQRDHAAGVRAYERAAPEDKAKFDFPGIAQYLNTKTT